jgi:hypothetical protein
MTEDEPDGSPLATAIESGHIGAVTRQLDADLRHVAADYPGLFPDPPFDPPFYGALALACASNAPWHDAGQLRMMARAALWVFGVDLLIDFKARERTEVADLVQRCVAAANGGAPDQTDEVAHLLARIRADLATVPGFAAASGAWTASVRRVLDAMAREWAWKIDRRDGQITPTVDDYLANADNFGSSFVNLTHWLYTDDPALRDIDNLRVVSDGVQRVLRLLNDLQTFGRDTSWGDLNVLMLGPDRGKVDSLVRTMVVECRKSIAGLPAEHGRAAAFLDRQIGFSMGFYRSADYWGRL